MAKKVLLVDGNREHRRLYLSALQNHGFEVAAADSAQAALDALDDFQPNLVVTEIILPANNGLTIIKEMMTYQDWANIPVVILSSLKRTSLDSDDIIFSRLNIKQYCYKPEFLPRAFAQIIAKIVS